MEEYNWLVLSKEDANNIFWKEIKSICITEGCYYGRITRIPSDKGYSMFEVNYNPIINKYRLFERVIDPLSRYVKDSWWWGYSLEPGTLNIFINADDSFNIECIDSIILTGSYNSIEINKNNIKKI